MGFVAKAFKGGQQGSTASSAALDKRLKSLEEANAEAAAAVEARSAATADAEAQQEAVARRMRRRRGLLAYTEDADSALSEKLSETLGG